MKFGEIKKKIVISKKTLPVSSAIEETLGNFSSSCSGNISSDG